MLDVQLADVLTRCSSHPQGKSEARCIDMFISDLSVLQNTIEMNTLLMHYWISHFIMVYE